MRSVGVKELKQNASRVLADVERGEALLITVSGRPVASLTALRSATPWVGAARIAEVFTGAETADGRVWLDELREQRRESGSPSDSFDAAGR